MGQGEKKTEKASLWNLFFFAGIFVGFVVFVRITLSVSTGIPQIAEKGRASFFSWRFGATVLGAFVFFRRIHFFLYARFFCYAFLLGRE